MAVNKRVISGFPEQEHDRKLWDLSDDSEKQQSKGELIWSGFPEEHTQRYLFSEEVYQFQQCRIPLPSALAEKVLEVGANSSSGKVSLLLRAVQYMLFKYCGNRMITTGVLTKNATGSKVERRVYPVLTSIDPGSSLMEQLVESGIMESFTEDSIKRSPLKPKKSLEPLKVERGESPWKTLVITEAIESAEEAEIIGAEMAFALVERNEAMILEVVYNGLLFSAEKVSTLSGQLLHLLMEALSHPNQPFMQLDIVPPEEKNRLLYEFNPIATLYPQTQTVVKLFESKVLETPDEAAVTSGNQQFTYQKLNATANRIAHQLQAQGIGSGSIVGIMAQPSLEMFSGVLGILKSGAAYLPIDPEYPLDRIQYMLNDSKAEAMLYQTELELPKHYGGRLIDLKVLSEGDEEESLGNPNVPYTPENLAYVIYTSGSTGAPKGVMIEHRALLNLCFWHLDQFEVTATDRATKYAGFGFDASVWEIFPYLLAGASIHIVPAEAKLDMVRLNHFFEEKGISISFLPTSICERFVRLPDHSPSLRILLTGGDRLKQTRNTPYKLVNNYGPTENTVVATSYTIHDSRLANHIGRPIHNTRIYIVDEYGALQPEGVIGEMCIAGDSLARGYLHNEALTAAKFVSNPFEPGEKMYRSGDYARWLSDGNIEFIGRIDDQVKIRGVRIELEEIENRLSQYPEVEGCVITTRENEESGKYLVAYYVARQEIPVSQLRLFLSETLPEAWMPSTYMYLKQLPITPNGKIDRRALPEPSVARPMLEVLYSSSKTETEQMLSRIWGELLEVEQIGLDDNFFDLGGNSLLLVSVHARLEEEAPGKVKVVDLFDYPSISKLARFIDERSQPAVIEPVHTEVMLRADCLRSLEEEEGDGNIRFRLEGWRAEQLRDWEEGSAFDLPSLFLAAFFYQIFEMSVQEEIVVQVLSEDLQWIVPVTTDFDDIYQFNELLEQVSATISGLKGSDGYPVYQAIDWLETDRLKNCKSIVPYFSYNDYEENMSLHQADLYVQIVEDLEGYECICDYRTDLWKEAKVFEFMEKYADSVVKMLEIQI